MADRDLSRYRIMASYILTKKRSAWLLIVYWVWPLLLHPCRASSERAKDQLPANPAIDAVDVRCLQILRATLHNLIVTLPDNWSLKTGARITRYTSNTVLIIIRNTEEAV